MSLLPPLAFTPCLPAELLSYILQQTCPATLIICGSREAFLSSLLEATSVPPAHPSVQQDSAEPESSQPSPSSESHEPVISNPQLEPEPQPQPQVRHPLLRATLYQISLSRKTTTAFVPTVSHLRAYLSVLSTTAPQTETTPASAGHDDLKGAAATAHPLLVVYGLVTLHQGTSEWSIQGLGLTCATAVEAGRRCARRVVLVEPLRESTAEQEDEGEEGASGAGDAGDGRTELTDVDSGGGESSEDDDEERLERERELRERHLQGIWHEKLPILSGSVRRAGAAGLEYGGRTVEVGTVLRRWFVFDRGDWESSNRI